MWSKTFERGWLRYAAGDKVYDRNATGRGRAELITKKAKPEKQAKKGKGHLPQGKRCQRRDRRNQTGKKV